MTPPSWRRRTNSIRTWMWTWEAEPTAGRALLALRAGG